MHARATRSVFTSPRLRGEVDLRALLREASRVRGPIRTLGLASKPPHPARKGAPTSPRKRGEERASCTAVHHFQRNAPREDGRLSPPVRILYLNVTQKTDAETAAFVDM